MDLKPNKMNVATGIIALIIVYLVLTLVSIDMNGNYNFVNPMIIFIAVIAGIIAFATAGFCGCCKSEGKEKATGKGAL